MLRFSALLAIAAMLGACGPTSAPCRRDCWQDCDRREIVQCDLACPAGTSETMPTECMDGGSTCERGCWSDCDHAQILACDVSCPEGTTDIAPVCDAGPPPPDAGDPFFFPRPDGGFRDAGLDGGPLGLCEAITREDVEAVVYSPEGRRVPPGFYWDEPLPEGTTRLWSGMCATTIDVVRANASRLYGAEQLNGTERTEVRHFEVETVRPADGETIIVRGTRCDYLGEFGELGDATFAGFYEAAQYLWVAGNGSDEDRFLAGADPLAPDTVALCEVRRTIAANGCDRLDLYALPRHLIDDALEIRFGSLVTRFQGECPEP